MSGKSKILPSKGMIQFLTTMGSGSIWKDMFHKFNCFSLYKAPKINSFLLWLMVASYISTYFIMYILLPAKDTDNQWRAFLIDNGLNLFSSSIIVLLAVKDTRNAGLATAWMINCGILFTAAIMGFSMQLFWYKVFSHLFMLGLGYYVIHDIYRRAKDETRSTE